MEQLMDKVIHRKIKLLKLLNSSDEAFSLITIAEFIGLSVKTTLVELIEMKEFLAKWDDQIQLVKQKANYRLLKKNTFNMELIYVDLNRRSFFYLFYTTLFFEKQESLSDFSKTYFFSYSHFYKNKTLLRQHLNQFNLGFKNESLTVTGEEISVRFFSYHFFWNHYEGTKWPFIDLDKTTLELQLNEIEKLFQLTFPALAKEQLLYWIGISKTRLSKKHLISETSLFHELATANPTYEKVLPWLKKIIFEKNSQWTEAEMMKEMEFLYFIFFLIIQPLAENRLIEEVQLPNQNLFQQSQNYLSHFYQIFQVDPMKKSAMVEFYFFEALFYRDYLNDNFISYLQMDEELYAVPQQFKQKFKAFYINEKGTNSLQTHFYSYTQLLLSTIVEKKHYRPKLYVTLISKKRKIEEQLLIKAIENMPYNVEVNKKNQELSDCIISDSIEIKNSHSTIFYWNSSPTQTEWKNLDSQLSQLEKTKLKLCQPYLTVNELIL